LTAKGLKNLILISVLKLLKLICLFIEQLEQALFVSSLFRNVDKNKDMFLLGFEFQF